MPSFGEMLAASCDIGVGYGERLLADVSADTFGSFARPGGQLVESNHPAFIYGHLSLYACRVIKQLGEDSTAWEPSDEFVKHFSHEAKCIDDPDNSIYPSMDEVTGKFFDGYRRASEVLRSADDALFLQENPNEGMRPKFPTMGAMHGFYVGGHVMMHVGQLSAWRRAMGLGPA